MVKAAKTERKPASEAQKKHRELMGKVGKQAWTDLKDGKIKGLSYDGGSVSKYCGKDEYKAHVKKIREELMK